ncbi:MAG: hypothetical protein LC630_03015, partial [Bacteroidales bacterium]|nr:hypothetical protein [Bacteroidales bacterium]
MESSEAQISVSDSSAFTPVSGADSLASAPEEAGGSGTLFGIPLDSYNIVTGKVRRNQFISSILSSQGVAWNDIEQLLRENRETFDPRRVRTGSSWSALLTKDTLSKADYFIYTHDQKVSYLFSLKDTLAIYRHDAEIKRMLRYSSGTINTSLWNAAMDNDLNPNIS